MTVLHMTEEDLTARIEEILEQARRREQAEKPTYHIEVRTPYGSDFYECVAYTVTDGSMLLVCGAESTEEIVATYKEWCWVKEIDPHYEREGGVL
jgi:hypothetical protein